MLSMSVSVPEVVPSFDIPDVYKVDQVDPVACLDYAKRALPLMLRYDGIEKDFVCDSDGGISELTNELLNEVVAKTGDFVGPVSANLSGYNLPDTIIGASNSNELHNDGCDDVGIVSLSGKARLFLAWIPEAGPNGEYLGFSFNPNEDETLVTLSDEGGKVGFVRPLAMVDCEPGTVVRIDQLGGEIVDKETGYLWILMHGLYNAVGQRISLQYRSYGAGKASERYMEGHIPRYASAVDTSVSKRVS